MLQLDVHRNVGPLTHHEGDASSQLLVIRCGHRPTKPQLTGPVLFRCPVFAQSPLLNLSSANFRVLPPLEKKKRTSHFPLLPVTSETFLKRTRRPHNHRCLLAFLSRARLRYRTSLTPGSCGSRCCFHVLLGKCRFAEPQARKTRGGAVCVT